MTRCAEETRGIPDGSALADIASDRIFTFDADFRIAWVNRAFWVAFGGEENVAGRTLCDVVQCRYAEPGGVCGAASACGGCGWFQAASACQRGGETRTECRVLSRRGEAFDFEVTVVALQGQVSGPVGLCALRDLAAQKRLRILERSFFHDVTNFAAGIRGLCEVVAGAPGGPDRELMALLHGSAEKMVDEIQRLRLLRTAESGGLVATNAVLDVGALLRRVVTRFADETVSRHLEVAVEDRSGGARVAADHEFLYVVLCDGFQNAVEASGRGDRVTLTCAATAGEVVFRIGNPAVLSDEARAHVFERSFTTRGAGKGVGAYRAKLLCEHGLGGKITVSSRAPEGTVFSVALPTAPQATSCTG